MPLLKELDIDSYYNKKINQRSVLITNLTSLKSRIINAKSILSNISENLFLGLTIDNRTPDRGKLSEYSEEYSLYINKIDDLIADANMEIENLNIEYKTEKAEARKRELAKEVETIKEERQNNKSSVISTSTRLPKSFVE